MDFVEDIKNGAIVLHPTDTIYGLGCDATKEESVILLREILGHEEEKPFSIIAPSISWVRENCVVEDELIEKYLPGPYTLILRKKDPDFLSHISSNGFLGIRIPDAEFTKLVEKSGVPFITTSVNKKGEPFAVKLTDVKHEILDKVDIVLGVGELDGRPSTLVKEDGTEVKR